MLICRIEGSATSSISHPSLKGWRLLIAQPVDDKGVNHGAPILCLDSLGAGMHQRVVVTSDGRSIREKVGDEHSPARYMNIAILDDEIPAKEAIPA